jgi:hypothetical protein
MSQRSYWQIAAGSTDRSYAEKFIDHCVALIGPGDAGRWTAEREDSDFDGSGCVRWFADELAPGDILVLRSGNSKITAIGVVASDYEYLTQFDDVNGWDLQHCRRARWYRLPAEHSIGPAGFGANPRRFSRIGSADVIAFAEEFLNSTPVDWQVAPLPSLPAEEEGLPSDAVPAAVRNVVALAHDLGNRLYWDRQAFGDRPCEHESVAHLVVPLFRALGWPPEHIGVEWRRADIAVFERLPRHPENCRFIIEAKKMGAGVEWALDQAKGYAEAHACKADLVVTDGLRYRLYGRHAGYREVAYANLARLKVGALKLFDLLARP